MGRDAGGSVFHVVAWKPNKIKSRPSVFRIPLQKGIWVWSKSLQKARGRICYCIDSLMEDERMAAAGSIHLWQEAFFFFYVPCVPQQHGNHHPTLSYYRREMQQDEKRAEEEASTYLHVSQAELRKPHAHTTNLLASVLAVKSNVDPRLWAELCQRSAQPIRPPAPLIPAMIFFAARQR